VTKVRGRAQPPAHFALNNLLNNLAASGGDVEWKDVATTVKKLDTEYAQAKKLLRKPDPIKHRLAKYVRRRR